MKCERKREGKLANHRSFRFLFLRICAKAHEVYCNNAVFLSLQFGNTNLFLKPTVFEIWNKIEKSRAMYPNFSWNAFGEYIMGAHGVIMLSFHGYPSCILFFLQQRQSSIFRCRQRIMRFWKAPLLARTKPLE